MIHFRRNQQIISQLPHFTEKSEGISAHAQKTKDCIKKEDTSRQKSKKGGAP